TDMMKLRDHSLCHGMMGNVDCLLSCLGLSGADADKVSALVSRQYDLVMRDIRDNGIVCGISNAYDMFSFMLGLPGIAYAILRRHDKSMPGILFLE
ncbi:MAG: hypothetical protein IJ711_05950, partial [Lachnospiraceae bacterium]|nr:hypothetical protein [Lachnospiraceae bacterium]